MELLASEESSTTAEACRAGFEPSEVGAAGDFVHLAVHSEFSVSDGLAKIKDLVLGAASLNMPALALTDHGNLFGLVKFHSACRDAGIKAIIGVDLNYRDADGTHHCTLLVTSEIGYRNLLQLVSSAYVDTSANETNESGANNALQHHGCVSREAVFAAAQGLIVLLGKHSDVGAALGNQEAAAKRLAPWRATFGDRVYLAVARTGRSGEGQFVADAVALAAAESVPVVASNEVRFLAREDFEAHETRV